MHTVNTTPRIERRHLHLRVDVQHLEHEIDALWPGMGYSIAYPGQAVRLSFLLEEVTGQAPTWTLHAALPQYRQMQTFCYRSMDTVRSYLTVGEAGAGNAILPEDYIAMHRKALADALTGREALEVLSGLRLHASFAYYDGKDGPDQAWFAARGWTPTRRGDGFELDMALSQAASGADLETDAFGLVKIADLSHSTVTLDPVSQQRLTEITAPAMASLF
ncbi:MULTISPECIES: hypothetical protein [unclassified Rhodanobacter]|uniref:hypothetical protein n=1 Tax=unclassified Rhodanobacter TaxID=2621553 RepID=UPI0007A9DEC6|nr:hypothetical protein [Rhodanobacter sp. FW510-R10]KZC32564.1 hypothetical protein RhoFW510R10_11650 [Rhodanobacter sp. FW510-R10]